MNETKIILTAIQVNSESQCPLYNTGEGFAVSVPQVVPNSGKACIYVIKELLGPIMEINCNQYQRTSPLPPIYCPKGVKFSAQIQQSAPMEETEEYTMRLKKVPIFSKLDRNALHEVSLRLEVQDFQIGENIIRKGTPGQNFYIVHKGIVQVLQERKSGGTQILTTLSENECFGEMSLLTGELCSATIRAATPVILLVISKEKFNELLKLVVELNQHFTKILADRLRKSNSSLDEALDKGVMGKLSMISLPELIQAINVSGRNGILTIQFKHSVGIIYCTQGKVIDCVLQGRLDLSPEESFFNLLTWDEGDFHFQQGISHDREIKIFTDPINLLMEGLRRLDESAKSSS